MDASAQIACCLICTLADAMKDCPACAFRVGLEYKPEKIAKTVKANAANTTQADPFLKFAAGYLANIPNGAK